VPGGAEAQAVWASSFDALLVYWASKVPRRAYGSALGAELRSNPDLIEEWRNYSADKRYSPAWYFDEKPNGSWAVGYHHQDQSKRVESVYADPAIACANFILKEMGA
jgi:hypothetical protein